MSLHATHSLPLFFPEVGTLVERQFMFQAFAEARESHMNEESQGSFHKALDLELPISISNVQTRE